MYCTVSQDSAGVAVSDMGLFFRLLGYLRRFSGLSSVADDWRALSALALVMCSCAALWAFDLVTFVAGRFASFCSGFSADLGLRLFFPPELYFRPCVRDREPCFPLPPLLRRLGLYSGVSPIFQEALASRRYNRGTAQARRIFLVRFRLRVSRRHLRHLHVPYGLCGVHSPPPRVAHRS